MLIFGCAVTWVAAKAFGLVVLQTLGCAALTGIGIRGGWLCLSWCLGKFKEFILTYIYEDPDMLMEKSYFAYSTPSFNESAYILHTIRKSKNSPGRFEEVIIKPENSPNQIVLELPLERMPWNFEIDVNDKKVTVELYLQYLSHSRRICVWATKEQCTRIKDALRKHNASKRK